MKRKIMFSLLGCASVGLVACGSQNAAPKPRADDASNSGALHKIDLPKFQPNLPDAPGRDLFASACLSCHTSKYISMQPAFPAAKWEDEVKKMKNTYKAPISDDQVQPIAQYLVAAQQSSPAGATWIARAANTTQKRPPNIDLSSADASNGAAVFARACASCHGPQGNGDGASARPLLPHPTDLTHTAYSQQQAIESIYNGVPATGMPSFAVLPHNDLRDVVAYTLSLAKSSESQPPSDLATAKTLYTQNCASCHGADGAGDGVNAPVCSRPPANFHNVQPTVDQAVKVISDGVAGTTMPEWKAKLSDDQRKLLAEYVRTFYRK